MPLRPPSRPVPGLGSRGLPTDAISSPQPRQALPGAESSPGRCHSQRGFHFGDAADCPG